MKTATTTAAAAAGAAAADGRAHLAIDVADLRKSYGKLRVLDGINLQVTRGSLLALLGPNGAGKTTTVRILTTLLRYDSGSARVFGHDIARDADAARRRMSVTGQFASVDDELTGMENLILVARLLGYSWSASRARAAELIRDFDLDQAGERTVNHYSGGMRRRLDIAASIVAAPDLLFLDEPTTGLDPRSRRHIWDVIRALRASGTTVLLTTQYLEEAGELADRVVILDNGSIIADGTPGELQASLGSGTLQVRLLRVEQRTEALQVVSRTLGCAARLEPDSTLLSAPVADAELVAATLAALTAAGVGVAEFSLARPSLDEVFLALTGHRAVHATPRNEDAA